MTNLLKILGAVVLAVIVLDVAISSTLSHYDANAKGKWILNATQELRPHATPAEMVDFMRRHTTRYALDEKYNHEYSGYLPQSKLDRLMFDRKIQGVLNIDDNGAFAKADARVFYTGL